MRTAMATLIEGIRGNAVVLAFAAVGFLLTVAYGAYLAPDWHPVRNDQRPYLALARAIGERDEFPRAVGPEPCVAEPLRLARYPLFVAPLCTVAVSNRAAQLTQAR